MKAAEQDIFVDTASAFAVLYTVVLTSESVDEVLNCEHSNESY